MIPRPTIEVGRDRHGNLRANVWWGPRDDALGPHMRVRRHLKGGYEGGFSHYRKLSLTGYGQQAMDEAFLAAMNERQRAVLTDLRANGPSKAREIATRLGVSVNSITNTLAWLRGQRWVHDGSTAKRVGGGVAHTPARSPITWTALP